MIEKFFTTSFTVKRASWKTDGESNQYSELEAVSSFVGHLQQASAELVQSLGLNLTKTFTIWAGLATDVIEGDSIEKIASTLLENEIQTITPDLIPDAGTFSITFGDQTTDEIAYNATAEQIEEALELVLGEGNVSVTGTLATLITIEFINGLGGSAQELLEVDVADLTNQSEPVTVVIAQSQEGGATTTTEIYTVRAIQKNDTGTNPHLEIVVEFDNDNSVNT